MLGGTLHVFGGVSAYREFLRPFVLVRSSLSVPPLSAIAGSVLAQKSSMPEPGDLPPRHPVSSQKRGQNYVQYVRFR